ncbi:hypothetical protein M011DRAFT_210134 [Sporormia fimetaria CBS 119925]|uniref:Prolyl 4-hydroxylase alpha subunit domain-containing protein n=1 Tax=Sporormia fimetaria CBS 119925 TaxID=1340428 RepID=A0A6A6V1V9_9PLEO|nr:hypothetical protein M011DRAFT_210134 [Sporormia fimetaria CBS 119925]
MPPKKKSKPASKDAADVKRPVLASPNWPPLQPLLPESDLVLEERVPSQIVTIRNFFTAKLCRDYVAFLSALPLVTTPGKPKKGDAVRVNDRFQIEDAIFAERLWSGTSLKRLVCGPDGDDDPELRTKLTGLWGGEVVGLNPNIRIYRYRKGQFFNKHYDDANNVVIPGHPSTPAKTTWTLLIYLSSPITGCLGGETVFHPEPEPTRKRSKTEPPPEPYVVDLEVGLALLHRHGAQCMLHEGREVLEGEKWVIRSDLCVRR